MVVAAVVAMMEDGGAAYLQIVGSFVCIAEPDARQSKVHLLGNMEQHDRGASFMTTVTGAHGARRIEPAGA